MVQPLAPWNQQVWSLPKRRRSPWTREEDIIFLKGYLERKNKWSEIAKLLPGRSKDSVKNRLKVLFKEYNKEKGGVIELDEALEEITCENKDNVDWVEEMIVLRQNLKEPSKPKSQEKDKVANWLRLELLAETAKDLQISPEKHSDLNTQYTEQIKQAEEAIVRNSTKFINLDTCQEIYLSPSGIYIRNDKGRMHCRRYQNRIGGI
eukprot:TRINITY_DN120806_c1_g1_i1.p2 TRINITY_DN120806_c1_g1~~TRINITY_DN120806_c1_g1_i1.p2  ORF type:complete len:206 (+),score=16.13 TRINITY_DN120806_c1_g1_i1:847-1464(+)